jgi:hypothetical protein
VRTQDARVLIERPHATSLQLAPPDRPGAGAGKEQPGGRSSLRPAAFSKRLNGSAQESVTQPVQQTPQFVVAGGDVNSGAIL